MTHAPHNIEAEQALLGALLVNNDVYHQSGFLRPEEYSEPVHARIYEAIITLIRAGKVASPVTLKTFFERDETLAEIGGTTYLAKLAGAAVTILNAPSYAGLIRDLALRREVLSRLETAKAEISDLPIDQSASEYTANFSADLARVAEAGETRRTTVSAGDAVSAALDAGAEAYRLGGQRPGAVASGIVALDELTGGFAPGSLTIVGGRPSMGKTGLGVVLTYEAARLGKPALFISLEMTRVQLGARLLSMVSRIPFWRIETGRFSEAEYSALAAARNQLLRLPQVIDDRSGATIADVGALVARTAARHSGLALVVVDYLSLATPGERYKGRKVDEIGEITAALKGIAKRHSVAVVALCQLNRSLENRENRRPTMADLRDSGSIEQDADLILFPYRDEHYLAREPDAAPPGSPEAVDLADRLRRCADRMEIAVAKNRQGPVGVAHVACDMACNSISDLEPPDLHDERRP